MTDISKKQSVPQKRKVSFDGNDEVIEPKKPNLDVDDDTNDGRKDVSKVDMSRQCPYLDTINRAVLDFDFEKLCSVSLSHLNVYACLVCGKYFQGRGRKSHAYTHSVQEFHHVFLNLETQRFYCLPDNYEIIDSSLDDIIYVLDPSFSKNMISAIDNESKMSRAFDNTTYHPGIVGLNNIKANDYCNVILQALSHVQPIRNYFLQAANYRNTKRPPGDQMFLLVQRFGELLRKLWNPRHFKAHVSPHEMLQAVVLCSKKRFQITKQGDAAEFLPWFLNSLHSALNGTRKTSSTPLSASFRGRMKVYTQKIPPVDLKEEEKKKLLESEEYKESCVESPFMMLTCDLPAAPLYPDEQKENIIPQVPLHVLLEKFDGKSQKVYKTPTESFHKRFELTRLPKFLILCFKRFLKNTFILEKNPTIVNFPMRDVDLSELLTEESRVKNPRTTYDLIANIVHDGEPTKAQGTYRAHILHKGTGKWFEMQDLHVKDVLPQMITLSEAYIQIYELQADPPKEA